MAHGTSPEHLLDGLNAEQRAAVTAPEGRVVVLAGAGSGKTRVLTHRIAWRVTAGDRDPNRCLTLTFTRKAAAELRERQRALGLRDRIPAGTFHATALAQLRQRWTERRITPPKLLSSKTGLIGRLLSERGGGGRGTGEVAATDVAAEIDWARARLVTPETYASAAHRAGRRPPMAPEPMAELMIRFQQEKRKRRLVDFDDLLNLAIRDLQEDPDYAAAVRWRHRHFFVDEFQDVNPLQYALLCEWLGDRHDLFVVGDPNQAIYGWNGADPGLIDELAADPSATVVRLDDNYRSSPEILALASVALQPGNGESSAESGLRAHQPSGPVPTVASYADDRAEAAGLVQSIRRAHSADRSWSQQAVLVRTNAQLVVIEGALRAAGIPARIRGGPGPLGSPEVRAELQAIGRDGIDLVTCLEDLDERLRLPAAPGSEGDAASASITPAEADRRANLGALSRLIHEYLTSDLRPTGPGLVAWLDTLQPSDVDAEQADAVDLATFHGAKGLEWPIVHVAGLEDGYVPIVHALTNEARAEERRLLYVALTRAMEELHLSWARRRTFGLTETERAPSPALERLARRLQSLDGARPSDPEGWRRHIEAGRSNLAIASPDEPGRPGAGRAAARNGAERVRLGDELRRWRRIKARAARVPEGAIVDDRTLDGLLTLRPVDLDGLAEVPGLRASRVKRYGDELLAILAPEPSDGEAGNDHDPTGPANSARTGA